MSCLQEDAHDPASGARLSHPGSAQGNTPAADDSDIPWGFSFDANLATDAPVDMLPSLGGMMSFEGFDDFLASVHNGADPPVTASLFASPREPMLAASMQGADARSDAAAHAEAQENCGRANGSASGLMPQLQQPLQPDGQGTAGKASSVQHGNTASRSHDAGNYMQGGYMTASLRAQ